MTRQEFTSKTETISRKDAVPTLLGFVALYGSTFLLRWVDRRQGGDFVYGIIIVVVLLVFGWMYWSNRIAPRRAGLVCPHCALLLVRINGHHALITGNCKRCGKPVFSDALETRPPALAKRKPTKQEFISSMEVLIQKTKRREARFLAIAGAIIVSFVPLAFYLNSSVEAGRFDAAGLKWLILLGGALIGAGVLAFISVFALAAIGKLKRRGVPCPECGRPLSGPGGRVAAETGMCVYCGGKIFEEARAGS